MSLEVIRTYLDIELSYSLIYISIFIANSKTMLCYAFSILCLCLYYLYEE